MALLKRRGVPTRGTPLREGLFLLLHAGGVQRGTLFGRGLLFLLLRAGGVQRGTASLAGVWGCPPEIFYFCYYVRGESRGVAGVWGCPPEHSLFSMFCPLPSRKGARGMVRATIETTRSEAEVPHATPPQIATSQPPRNDRGGWHGGDLTSVMACPTLASTKAVKGFIRLQDLAEKRLQMCSEPCQIRRTPDGLCSSNQRSAPALAF